MAVILFQFPMVLVCSKRKTIGKPKAIGKPKTIGKQNRGLQLEFWKHSVFQPSVHATEKHYFELDLDQCCELTLTHDGMKKRCAWIRPTLFSLCTHRDKIWGRWDWPVRLLTCQIKYAHGITLIFLYFNLLHTVVLQQYRFIFLL